jgi:hypothetical protein
VISHSCNTLKHINRVGQVKEGKVGRTCSTYEEMRGCRYDLCVSGKGPVAGFCQYGSEPSVTIKVRKFLDHPDDSFPHGRLFVLPCCHSIGYCRGFEVSWNR